MNRALFAVLLLGWNGQTEPVDSEDSLGLRVLSTLVSCVAEGLGRPRTSALDQRGMSSGLGEHGTPNAISQVVGLG